MGAYEYQGNGSGEFFAWLQGYELPTDSSSDYVDSDGDGMNNWQEWWAGTSPTNPASVFAVLTPIVGPSGVTISWPSTTNRSYFIQRGANLATPGSFETLAANIAGQGGIMTYNDSTAIGPGPWFYRVGIDTGQNASWPSFSVISFAWLQQFGFATDGSADYSDVDGDGMNNWQEWRSKTDPTNALSLLKMLPPGSGNNASGINVSWQSVSGLTYYVQRALSVQGPFNSIRTQTPSSSTSTFKDTLATGPGPYFYRVLVP